MSSLTYYYDGRFFVYVENRDDMLLAIELAQEHLSPVDIIIKGIFHFRYTIEKSSNIDDMKYRKKLKTLYNKVKRSSVKLWRV